MKAILFVFFVTGLTIGKAQDIPTIITHFNQPVYSNGGQLKGNIYLPTLLQNHPMMIHLELVNQDGDNYELGFLYAKGDPSVRISVALPIEAKGGTYELRGSIYDKGEQKIITLLQSKIILVNITEENPEDNSEVCLQKSTYNFKPLPISEIASTHNIRSKISMDIGTNNALVWREQSIGVLERSLYGAELIDLTIQEFKVPDINISNASDQMFYAGTVLHKGKPVKIGILAGYLMTHNKMLYSKSDESGQFIFDLPLIEGAFTIQIISNLFDEYDEVYVSQSNKKKATQQLTDCFNYSLDHIATRFKEIQKIKTHFEISNEESPKKRIETVQSPDFKKIADLSYPIEKTKSGQTVSQYFDDLEIYKMKFANQNGEPFVQVYNPSVTKIGFYKYDATIHEYFQKKPVFIIDGYLTRDVKEITQLPINEIKNVNVFNNGKTIKNAFGTFGNYAYIHFELHGASPLIQKYRKEKLYSLKGVSEEQAEVKSLEYDRSIPLFKSYIYWNSNNNEISNQISFNHDNDMGDFKYQILRQAEDGSIYKGDGNYKVIKY